MKLLISSSICLFVLFLTGCSTTNSIPYKASTNNIVAIQTKLQPMGAKLNVGAVTVAGGIDEAPNCRLMGPVSVSPGKSIGAYIQEAFQEELFAAGVYSATSKSTITGVINKLNFSSTGTGSWDIGMTVSSSNGISYAVLINYPFRTSFDAISACKNVADAFGPATQELLKQVINNPQFTSLAK
jgi:hypothetical protein